MTLIEKLQKRANLVTNMRALMDEFKDSVMPADKEAEYSKMEADFDKLNKEITREQAQLDRERAMGETQEPPKKDKTSSLFANALSGDPEKVRAYQNAMDLGTVATAGYLTAPVEFVQDLIKGLDNILFMRRLANVVGPIGAAQSMGFPYQATDATDADWTAEVTAAPEENTLSYGRREFKPNKLAKLIKLSRTLIRHAPMAESTVRNAIITKVSTAQEKAYMTGDGTAKPLGVFTASANGIPTARDVSQDNTATTVTFEGLMNAKYSIKQQYWPNLNWAMHRDLAKMLAKIKGTDGQYVWQPSVAMGQPDRLLNAPVNMSEYAPNTYTTGLYAAVLGDFKNGYWICDADTIAIQVLLELFAVNNQVGYLVDYFGDGAPVLGEAFARVKLG